MITHTAFAITNTNVFKPNYTNTNLDISICTTLEGYTIISSTPEFGQDIITIPNKPKLISHIAALIHSKFPLIFDKTDYPLTRYIIKLATEEQGSIVVLQQIQNHITPTVLIPDYITKDRKIRYKISLVKPQSGSN